MTATERSRRWREANREKFREYHREYQRKRRRDPAQREKDAAGLRAAYAANPEYWRERSRRWARENPEKACAAQRRRAARVAAAPGQFTSEEFAALCLEHDHRCFYCGSSAKLVAEHMTPLSRGGTNDIANIVPACRPCNSSKGSMTADEYMRRKEN